MGGQHSKEWFPKASMNKAIKVLQLMHLDLCAPLSIFSFFGSKFFFTFINDFNKNTWVLFLSKKSETLNTFKMFKVVVKKQDL
jgi:hypothetical protein